MISLLRLRFLGFSARSRGSLWPHSRGFTLIEVMVVVAIVAILALVAMPSMTGKMAREQIVEAVKLADIVKPAIAAAWSADLPLPADNAEAGVPTADKIVSNLVSAVTVDHGVIHITFGNNANGALKGKVLSLRPAVVEDEHLVPIAWVCAHAAVPDKMRVQGTDRTDLTDELLPLNCRNLSGKG
jgi:type IV pilus assembly protein PilA